MFWTILIFALLLTIFVHELGHLLAALVRGSRGKPLCRAWSRADRIHRSPRHAVEISGDPDWGSGRLARQSVRSSLDLTIAGAGPTPHRRRWIFCQASERAHADLFGWGWADLQLGTGEQYISPSVDLGGQNLLSDGILSSMELRIALTVGGLSVLSGLFDLLPVPPPDGGRLVLLAVEALRGRTVSSQA